MGTKYYDFTYINEPAHKRVDLVPETSLFLDQIDAALHAVSGEVDGVASLSSEVDGEYVKIQGLDSAGAVLSEVAIKIPKCVKTMESSKDGDTITITGRGDDGEVVTSVNFDVSTEYELPIASADALGGIKVGQNLTISNDGTLSATGGSAEINVISPQIVDTAATAATDSALAIGSGAVAANIGSDSKAVAVGADANAGMGACAIGAGSVAASYNSVALGQGTSAAQESVAVGDSAKSTNSGIAIGSNSNAGGAAVAIGSGTHADVESSISIGNVQNKNTSGSPSVNIGNFGSKVSNSSVTIAAGRADGYNSDAGSCENSVQIVTAGVSGVYAKAKNAVALGGGTYGNSMYSLSNYGVVIGYGAQNGSGNASDTANVAIGSGAKAGVANVKQCVAIGDNAEATEANTVSFGNSKRTPRIVNVGAPSADSDAATKAYTDAAVASVITPVNIALTPADGVNVTLTKLGAWSSGSLRAGCILGISNKTDAEIVISGDSTFATLAEALQGSQVSRTSNVNAGEMGPILSIAADGVSLSLSQDVTIAVSDAVVLQILEEVL